VDTPTDEYAMEQLARRLRGGQQGWDGSPNGELGVKV
jgi:hypothetical protein